MNLNSFAVDLYRQLASSANGNLILSPFNIASALEMVLVGARGKTAAEMERVLQGAEPGKLLIQGGANELETANALWVQKDTSIERAFEERLRLEHHASVALLDFVQNAEAARAQINAWTEERTKRKVNHLLAAGSVDALTRLVLTSAIYFYGKWEKPFDERETKAALFTRADGSTIETDFMNQTGVFGFAETPTWQVLEMSYVGRGIAFDVVLPKKASGLADVEKSFTGEMARLVKQNVRVSLPKFRAESEFELSNALETLGMESAFTAVADFSGVSAEPLFISKVIHKAFVDVSEKGTEAAAAAAVVATRSLPVVFRADRPFLFCIRDTESGLILFIGRYWGRTESVGVSG